MIRIGVDFGGTKIEAAAIDGDGEFRARIRSATPANYDAALKMVCELVQGAERQAGTSNCTIGIGTPGSISPRTGAMRNANAVWLNGRRFHEDLSSALGRPVRIANDANCLALSEVTDGAAAGSKIAFAVILGTGCGGGLIVNGQLVEGAHGVGGEWGHISLPWPSHEEVEGPSCWCGQRGCLETWVSGSGLQRDYAMQTNIQRSAENIIELARSGEDAALSAVRRYIHRLGRGIAVICNIVDPDTIVIGGGMSNVRELYEKLPPVVRSYVFTDAWEPRIVQARWGDSSGVRGAARLWPLN
ncbi:ROK family protein [Steroidobacter sp. S1-65]|uniref:ROK family protein n=1 Tax=Steroidobacter gossypii TaxID=2805490 RepID=A0ABS1WV46_9GAMM|nr:ROK family protein [Steroidobacter gossypii]MBM0104842.1 ROK family protein [Steroidobacter gossypii]